MNTFLNIMLFIMFISNGIFLMLAFYHIQRNKTEIIELVKIIKENRKIKVKTK